jgi:hypothetical protein
VGRFTCVLPAASQEAHALRAARSDGRAAPRAGAARPAARSRRSRCKLRSGVAGEIESSFDPLWCSRSLLPCQAPNVLSCPMAALQRGWVRHGRQPPLVLHLLAFFRCRLARSLRHFHPPRQPPRWNAAVASLGAIPIRVSRLAQRQSRFEPRERSRFEPRERRMKLWTRQISLQVGQHQPRERDQGHRGRRHHSQLVCHAAQVPAAPARVCPRA